MQALAECVDCKGYQHVIDIPPICIFWVVHPVILVTSEVKKLADFQVIKYWNSMWNHAQDKGIETSIEWHI